MKRITLPILSILLLGFTGIASRAFDGLTTNEYDAFYHLSADSYTPVINVTCADNSRLGSFILRISTWEDNNNAHLATSWSPVYTVITGSNGKSCFSDGTKLKTVSFIHNIVGDGFETGSPFSDAWFGQSGGAYLNCYLFSYNNSSGTGDHGWSPTFQQWQYKYTPQTITVQQVDNAGSGPGHGSVNGGAHLYTGHNVGTITYNFTIPLGAGAPSPNQPFTCSGGCSSCKGMAVASLDRFQTGVAITDTPVSYMPALGGGMPFTVNYHQRLANQPTTFTYSNMGPLWQFGWISYIAGGPPNSLLTATHYAPDGSQYDYSGYPISTPEGGNFTGIQAWTHGKLHYAPQQYTLTLPDGSVQTFAQGVGTAPNRLFFLTSITDPQGNVTTLNYDQTAAAGGQAIITSINDPSGGKLIFGYNTASPLQITRVTRSCDGLSAKFNYTSGQLTSITDTIGITSAFHYTSGTNFIDKMTTPYGNTTFSSTDGTGYMEADMTNPLGQTERVEYQNSLSTSLVAASDTSVPSATGLTIDNTNLNVGNTYYWSRRAMSDAAAGSIATDSAAFYALAEVTHWAQDGVGTIPVPLSTKKRLEGRVWYNYPSQPNADTIDVTAPGASTSPSLTARLLDGGATQASKASYSTSGLITQSVDPLGRTTNYTYASNGTDLTQVSQTNGAGQDVLSVMTYNSAHLPLTVKDASGQTTTMTFNSLGQPLTRTVVVGGSNQTTTLAYYGNGFLHTVTGPISGAVTTYAYDSVGRVSSVTDSEGYVITTAYDNLDRPTVTTYPDSTTDQTVYHNLDVAKQIDRQGRTSTNQYDAIRELVQTTDPLGCTTKYSWCTCGGLSTLTDANGSVTTWGLDGQGRITSKTYADASVISYVYETNTSRLHSMTDAKGNLAVYNYNNDNTLAGTIYTPGSGVAATPNVSFGYDSIYNRVTYMSDGTGTTTYAYNAITGTVTTGAGRLHTVVTPIATGTATVTFSYDELGRVTNRTIDSGNSVSSTFDTLGRVTAITNPLGAFTYAYVDQTSRLSSVTYPSSTGLSTVYCYFGNSGDQRLQEIKNLKGTAIMSDFQYQYNAVGTIKTWTQQTDSNTPTQYALTYDAADQLTDAEQTNTSTSATISSNLYNYDPAGNRLAETTTSGTTAARFNNLNQLLALTSSATAQTVSGYTTGTISSATINALPATITNGTNFTANVPLPSGTNILSVEAFNSGSLALFKQFSTVTSGSAPTTLSYDANGNCTSDENGNTYEWDALNRLTAINYFGSASSEFSYDGLSRRVKIVEKDSTGTVTSTKNYLWVGSEIAEERDTSNAVTKRFFPYGEQQSGTAYYYTRDNLGSVRETCDSSGSIVSRLGYDMYGKTTVIIGTNLPTLGFAGMYWHQASGLYLTSIGNTYDANTGRWLGRDLLGEDASLNLYQYCFDDPVDWTDPLGLACEKEATELLAAQYGLKVADNALAEAQKFLNSIQSQASKRVLFDILMQQAKDKFAIAHSNRNRAYARLQSALDALRECWKKNPPGGGTPCPAPAPAPTPAPATPAPAPATNTPPADPTVPNRFPDQTIPANRPPAYRPAPFAPAPIFRPIPVF